MRVYLHLSDTHFGAKGAAEALPRLKELIREQLDALDPDTKVGFIVTGDGVDSPRKANNKQYLDFSDYLQETSGREPLFVLGNHDVNFRGLAFLQGNQILANYVGGYPRLKRPRGSDLVFLLFNSNTDGFLAQGEIGAEQMADAAELLSDIKDRERCTVIAVLHHHIAPVPESRAPRLSWWRRHLPQALLAILPKALTEGTRSLTDADEFVRFLKDQKIRFVLHGHKHIPFITAREGIQVIACGSSTHRQGAGQDCLSYNVLTFDETTLKVDQYAEYTPGAGAEVIASEVFER
ncbi:MAG: metallophosphoesterase [Actinomycetia bacterium]|nr:metallophosphoesterase [Actinomycetes bacterium]